MYFVVNNCLQKKTKRLVIDSTVLALVIYDNIYAYRE